jgi:hypothetical protein
MTCILELNDAGITVYRDRAVLHRTPGVAVVLDDAIQFGEPALRLSRMHPRQTNQQYFALLNADPLPAPGGRARNHADLVYLHLQTLKPHIDDAGGEVLLAVPGILSPDQLGVLLGVLQEVGIGVSGFVDAAVAASSTQAGDGRIYHIDTMLQRIVITALEMDEQVSKHSVQEVPECGLLRILDSWINVVADRFVRETRFDPLHAAATEQQLFNQVYDWADQGAGSSDLTVEIDHAGHTRRVELGRAALEEKAGQRFRQLADAVPMGSQVFVSARSARLPGLRLALHALQAEIVELPGEALAGGCLQNLAQIIPESGELRLVTRLPASSGMRREAPAPARAAPATPTHVVYDGVAVTLRNSSLPVRCDAGNWFLDGAAEAALNDGPVHHAHPLAPGDRIRVGDREHLIIRVED